MNKNRLEGATGLSVLMHQSGVTLRIEYRARPFRYVELSRDEFYLTPDGVLFQYERRPLTEIAETRPDMSEAEAVAQHGEPIDVLAYIGLDDGRAESIAKLYIGAAAAVIALLLSALLTAS